MVEIMEMSEISKILVATLAMRSDPIAISFHNEIPLDVQPFAKNMPAPTSDGRTGRVAAGCVFWMEAAQQSFSTVRQDHANCSVGSFTHGFLGLEAAAQHSDVATLLEAGWVTEADFGSIEHVSEEPTSITYSPLSLATTLPNVVLLRLDAMSAMLFRDTFPDARIEGKPQCHIVAIAKQTGQMALSFGCMLSRTRTKMPSSEMTAAIPGSRLVEAVERLSKNAEIDRGVAAYASQDSRRFAASNTV